MQQENNLHPHKSVVTREMRELLNKQKSCIIFFTGLSASGKSTIANILEKTLYDARYRTYILDGDSVRTGLNKNLGFSDDDRKENIRRVAEVAKLFSDSGQIVMTAFIAPFEEDRRIARDIISQDTLFIEVYVEADIKTCEDRDPKGLYRKARAGQIKNFTGIDSEYQVPINPEIILKTNELSPEDSAMKILNYLYSKNIL